MSGESDVEVNGHVNEQDQTDKVLSRGFRWMSISSTSESTVETCSTTEPSDDYTSRKSEIDTYLDRNLRTGSDTIRIGGPHIAGGDSAKRLGQ